MLADTASVYQGILINKLETLFPRAEIFQNAKKNVGITYPDSNGKGFMEFDAWIPSLQLCFEFQDPYHYVTTWYYQDHRATILLRDTTKKLQALQRGLSLLPVPCWWDASPTSLMASINFIRPDMPLITKECPPISLNPVPSYFRSTSIPGVGELMLASFPFEISRHVSDFSSWWMGEKYDGVRCCWNPFKKFVYSRNGQVVAGVPSHLTSALPLILLDAEFWFGRGQFSIACGIFKEISGTSWYQLRMTIFDTPSPSVADIPFEHRYRLLLLNILPTHCFAVVVGRVQCTHQGHMQDSVKAIIQNGGEGVILRRAQSRYVHGHSNLLLKIKAAMYDTEALVVNVAPDGSVELELPNGKTMVVPSTAVEITEPKEGDVVSVMSDSQDQQGARIVKNRADLSWDDVLSNHPHLNVSARDDGISPGTKWTFENARHFLENFAVNKELDPSLPDTWYNVSYEEINSDPRGRSLLAKFSGNYYHILQNAFPELELDETRIRSKVLWNTANRRTFFEKYASTNNFDAHDPENWYNEARHKILQTPGANRVLAYHNNSVPRALLDLFPEIMWDKTRLNLSWHNEVEARKALFDSYAIRNSFDPLDPDQWCRQPLDKIIATPGARRVLSYYNNSLAKALSDIYPQIGVDATMFDGTTTWSSPIERRKFFENYAKEHQINPLLPLHWYSHPRESIMQQKGIMSVLFYHNNSLSTALADLFPEIGFSRALFKRERNLWGSATERRMFFEDYASSRFFDSQDPNNWYSQVYEHILAKPGARAVLSYHNNSIPQALTELFPDIGLSTTMFQLRSEWRDIRNRRRFFEEYAQYQGFNPRNPENWYSQSIDHIAALQHAKSVLLHHNNSVPTALAEIFTDIGLDRSKFTLSSKWHSADNRREFFEVYAKENRFDPLVPDHWYLQDPAKIKASKGAKRVLFYHRNSVPHAIFELFPAIGIQKRKLIANMERKF